MKIESTTTRFRLVTCFVQARKQWKWIREDDRVTVSPIFDSLKCAQEYPKKMPLLTNDEWELETPSPDRDKLEVIRG